MTISNTCITIEDLPDNEGKTGWPWTEQSTALLDQLPSEFEWPRISIVTPSYNQGQFIEETIRSVLLQGYPNLEYIIVDGGSTDGTIEIIQKYEHFLFYWHSQKDDGQSDAINQGFRISTGQLMAWLCSDDLLEPNALYKLMTYYRKGLKWWIGGASQLFQDGSIVRNDSSKSKLLRITRNDLLHARAIIPQPSIFWTRELWEEAGGMLKSLDLAMDFELWLRFSSHVQGIFIPENLAIFRTHSESKTGRSQGFFNYQSECDLIRLNEYRKCGFNKFTRSLLINFWTRFYLVRLYDWRSLIGKREIPYI